MRIQKGPLVDSYAAAVALVVCSLIPYLALSSGVYPLVPAVSRSVGLGKPALELVVAISTGAYAAGTVLAVSFATHLPARRMLVLYEAMFVVASILAACAPNGIVFAVAFVAQGLCTSLMLIAAVPPLVIGWSAKRMPLTGAIMNLCVFGAVAAGPSLGGLLAASDSGWRVMFWGVAVVAVVALTFALLTYEDVPASEGSAPWDPFAIALAVLGCGAAFFGAGLLQASKAAGPASLVPLLVGAAAIVVLVVDQYRRQHPLMPVKAAATTVPVTGIFIALATSAASFGVMVLVLQVLQQRGTPSEVVGVFLPELAAAIAMAVIFGLLFPTRFTPVLALGGMLAVVAAAILLAVSVPGSGRTLGVVTGLLGLGVGASVSPGLFLAGFSLPSRLLQRIFALIELLRGVTAFLFAPALVFLAGVLGTSPTAGVASAAWICAVIGAVGFLAAVGLYLAGRPRLVAPDLQTWHDSDDRPAWESPPILGAVRGPR